MDPQSYQEQRPKLAMNDKMNGRQEQAPTTQESDRSLGAQFQHDTTVAALHPPGLGSMRSAPSYTSSSIDVGSSSSFDIPAGTFDEDVAREDRPSEEDEAARKERKRLKKEKKKHSHSKDPEAKRKKKEKKAKKEKRRRDKNRISGDSGEGAVLLSEASSAEPRDLVRDQMEHHSSAPRATNGRNAWQQEFNTTANTLTPGSSSSPVVERRQSLSAIIQEQEAEQRAEKMNRERAVNFDVADSKEIEALGGALPGETDEERMLRLAVEMSLNDYKKSQRNVFLEPPQRPRAEMRSTSVPVQRIPHPDMADASSGGDDISLREGDSLVRSNSHRSLYSSYTMEATEVVIEDPRGNMKSQRRISTHHMLPTPHSRSESSLYDDVKKPGLRGSRKNHDDPKAHLFDDDPKAQFSSDESQNPLSHWDRDDAKKKFFDEELDEEHYSEIPRRPPRRASNPSRRASTGAQTRPVAAIRPVDQIRLARQNLSAQEAEEIERALREAGEDPDEVIPSSPRPSSSRRLSEQSLSSPPSQRSPVLEQQVSPSLRDITSSEHLSPNEAAEIAKALQEADEAEARQSFQLALQLQSQEATLFTAQRSMRARQQASQGNVRVVPREAVTSDDSVVAAQVAQVGAVRSYSPPVTRHPLDDSMEESDYAEPGYRINSSRPSRQWSRVRDHVVGPNNEVRTKHDAELQAQSNARRMGLDEDDEGYIGNAAFNSFKQSMQRQTIKGVAAHGTGRANSDTDKTKSGAMDPRVRMLITRAINNRLIEKCNGVVREGKEAVIYHADQGEEGGGYDVAIKVFKRIQEFRGRGSYVEGDPRFEDGKFKNANSREQLEMWAEKEYRNLLRANRSGVPVPTPLIQKENVVFMRFLGEDGWAVPQLKDLNIRKGSDKWTTLYSQIMVAVRR